MRARALLLWLLAVLTAGTAHAAEPALLPRPAHVEARGEGFDPTKGFRIVAPGADRGAANAAARLGELLQLSGMRAGRGGALPVLRFERRAGLPAEGYRLETRPEGAIVTASDDAGLFYGAVTLWQLAAQGPVPGLVVEDAPRFAWRGLMLDSARHFQSPAFVRQLIDWMAVNKLNRLHWHLVDDQGWRIQIRKYPKLTRVSAWRRPAVAPGAPPLPATGGFYTQAEIRALVAYASARGITVIPEIEMPGHATAAIRAYPKLGMGVPLPEDVWSDWGVYPWLYNPDEPTFRFLEDVLDEVIALFPGPWIHVGGDEATKDQWRASSAVQAKIKALGLKDENALQGWFTARIGRYLAAHGRRLIGWDEILEGGVPASATLMSWRGIDGAIAAAKAGHDTVLSPAPTLYLDNRQGTGPQEPPGRGKVVSLADILAFDPAPSKLSPAEQRHVIGLQANLWTEHVRTEARAAWMLFPRALAIAEIGWTPADRRQPYAVFVSRVTPQLARLAPMGLKAADSAFVEPPAPLPMVRTSRQLETCGDAVKLDLEDDYPAAGPRAHFLTDIMHPCWTWRDAPVDQAREIVIDVGQVPFNFQLGADRDKIRFAPPVTPAGEFVVRDGCEGGVLATLPLAPAEKNPGVTALRAPLPARRSAAALCITYTARGVDPMWAVDRVTLVPR